MHLAAQFGLPQKGVHKRGCNSLILHLLAFVCVWGLFARICLRLGSVFREPEICICARLSAFVCECKHPLSLHPLLQHPDQYEIRAIPFRDSIAEGVSHPFLLTFMGDRERIAEMPLAREGIPP